MISKLLPVALTLAAAISMPPVASAQAPPDERAAAREFAYAAYRLRVRVKDDEPAMRRAVAFLDSRACRTALGEVDAGRLPQRVQRALEVLSSEEELGEVYGLIHGHFSTFVAELDRVPTADPALAAGREAWRTSVQFIAQIRPLPRDTCARIRRWRLDGFPLDRVPALQPEPVHRMLVEREVRADFFDAICRTSNRMVELGATAGQARRFTGWWLFSDVIPRLEEHR